MKCLNWNECHSDAKPPHSLCEKCLRDIKLLLYGDQNEARLRQLERKPRSWRDVWQVRGKR